MLPNKTIIALLILLSPLTCFAETIVILAPDGAYYAPDGVSDAVKVDRVINLNPGPGPGPSDPGPSDPLKNLSSQWKTKVNNYEDIEKHRRSLAAMYMLLSQQIKEGNIQNLMQLQEATKRAKDILLGQDAQKWDMWGNQIAEYLAVNVNSLDQAADAYLEISKGLESNEALSPELLALIMEIIKLVLSLIDR